MTGSNFVYAGGRPIAVEGGEREALDEAAEPARELQRELELVKASRTSP